MAAHPHQLLNIPLFVPKIESDASGSLDFLETERRKKSPFYRTFWMFLDFLGCLRKVLVEPVSMVFKLQSFDIVKEFILNPLTYPLKYPSFFALQIKHL